VGVYCFTLTGQITHYSKAPHLARGQALNVAGQLLHRGAALGHLVPAYAGVKIFTIAAGPVQGAAGRASFPQIVGNWQRAGFAVSAVSNECVKHGGPFS
jgi:hypothetical protein